MNGITRVCSGLAIVFAGMVPVFAEDGIANDDLLGVYTNGAEIAGFQTTKLAIEKTSIGTGLRFREHFTSDVKSDAIRDEDGFMACVLTNGRLIFATPIAFKQENRMRLMSRISVYVPVRIESRIVLFSEDSYKMWSEKREVFDYGLLIKVKERAEAESIEKEVVAPVSIKELFKIEKWSDPFVNGPNKSNP